MAINNTKKWSEVKASSSFQELSAEERNAAQEQYFNEVIKPKVLGSEVQLAKQQFYKEHPKATSGFTGAVSSSMSRLEAGGRYLLGDKEGATEALTESYNYVPEVKSYKDIKSPMDLLDYVEGTIGSATPYLGGVILAPFTGGGSLALDGVVAAMESSAIYQEQKDKDVLGAVTSGFGSQALSRIGLKGAGSGVKGALGVIGLEGAKGGAQQILTNTAGYGMSFEEATKNIDESIIGSTLQMVTARGVSKGISKAGEFKTKLSTSEPLPTAKNNVASRVIDEVELRKEGSDYLAGISDDKGFGAEIDRIWSGRELENTVAAAQKLNREGGVLTSLAFDIDVNKRGGSKINLAKELNLGTSSEKISNFLQSNFDVPVISKMLPGDPLKAYKATESAYQSLRSSFNETLSQKVTELGYKGDDAKDIIRNVQGYIDGEVPRLQDKVKISLAEGGLKLLDGIVQTKRMRQMTEKMKPQSSEESMRGVLGGLGVPGIEAIATGGAPVISTTVGGVATGLSRLMSAKSRDVIKSKLEGKEISDIDAVIDAVIQEIAQGVQKSGVSTQDKPEHKESSQSSSKALSLI